MISLSACWRGTSRSRVSRYSAGMMAKRSSIALAPMALSICSRSVGDLGKYRIIFVPFVEGLETRDQGLRAQRFHHSAQHPSNFAAQIFGPLKLLFCAKFQRLRNNNLGFHL